MCLESKLRSYSMADAVERSAKFEGCGEEFGARIVMSGGRGP